MEDGKKKKTRLELDQEEREEITAALGLEKIDPLKLIFYGHLAWGKIRPKDMLEGLAIRCQEYNGDYLAIAEVIHAVTTECGVDYLEEWLDWLEKPFFHQIIGDIGTKETIRDCSDEFVLGYLLGIFRSLTWADKTAWANNNDIINLLTRRLKALPIFFLPKNPIADRFEKDNLPLKFKKFFQNEVDAFMRSNIAPGSNSEKKERLVKQVINLSKEILIKQGELSKIGKYIIERLCYAYIGGHDEIGLMHLISD